MKSYSTLSVHSGTFSDAHGAVMPPIYATSTFAQPAPGQHTGYEIFTQRQTQRAMRWKPPLPSWKAVRKVMPSRPVWRASLPCFELR